MRLLRCGHPETGGRFCPECGVEAVVDPPAPDPFVGRMIGERYRVGELLNVGGMGRVYRGVQTSLDRPVAIKLIHPHLMTSEEVVGRFLTEARASSRLNHPNVVSIYDFGRMPPSDSNGTAGHLFLVMELLSGRDLRGLMAAEPLPLKRIADVLRQTLAALGEAHHLGITHRDVKPENILLESRRGEPQHVKVIDFGIAYVGGEQRRTQAGRVFGTPWYMAPEQAAAGMVGPAADLYAVGVILFEMLTGKVPFDDDAPSSILVKHMSAPRPDPRFVAPDRNIPDDLARVCLRALEIDPAARFPDAESFAAAIVQTATSEAWSAGKSSMFPKRRSSAPPPPSGRAGDGPGASAIALADTAALFARTGDREVPLLGRDEDLEFVRAQLASPQNAPDAIAGLVLHGRAGVGRTRLLRAIVDEQRAAGTFVVALRAKPSPASETSFGGIAAIVSALAGLQPARLVGEMDGVGDAVKQGLRAILRHEVPADRTPESVRRTVDAALVWAARRAVERALGKRVLLAIDDVHEMDAASQCALEDLLEGAHAPGELFVLMTSEHAPEVGLVTRIRGRELLGLSRADASRLLGGGALPEGDHADVEPLYVAALRRWRKTESLADAPPSIVELLERWMRRLPPGQQRTIQALGVIGAGPLRRLAETLPRDDDLDDALRPLSEAGVVEVKDGEVRLRNALHGRVALACAPAGAVAELHARARAAIEETPSTAELRAFHALRGEPSFETFMIVEEAARVRARCGNDEAVVALLWDAMSVAREHELRGSSAAQMATSARFVFGRKLGDALIKVGRLDQAQGVLAEILDLAPPRDATRAHVLERLATIAHHRGRSEDAEQRRLEALAIAERAGDRELAERLRAPIPRIETKPPRRMIFKTPSVGVQIPRSAPSSPKVRASERM